MPRQERRAQLLAAAAAAFARGGFSGTSMDDVAAEAGITRLIVYRHFDSKEQLYRQVLDNVTRHLRDEFPLAEPTPRDPARAFLATARADPDGFVLLFHQAAHEAQFSEYATEVRRRVDAVAEHLIGGAVTDKVVRRWAGHTVVAYLVEATIGWIETGTPARDDEFVTMTTAGLTAMYLAWVSAATGHRRGRGSR